MITEDEVAVVKSQAIAAYPREAVWLVTSDGTYQVDNISPDPENKFKVSSADLAEALSVGIDAVIHSHCDIPAAPSKEDMVSQILSGVPWGVVSTNGETCTNITWWGLEYIPPLEERPFIHGVSDCYSIVRDYFRLKGVALADVPRDWQWWTKGQNLIEDTFDNLGFTEVGGEPIEGDVLLFKFNSDIIHHCAVYLGDGIMVHHPGSLQPLDSSRLSVKIPVGRYTNHITKILRLRNEDT